MKISELFPSKYLKVNDLPEEGDLIVTISDLVIEPIGNDPPEPKPVLYFRELPKKGLVLNKTNSGIIESLYGGETDLWLGKKIGLYAAEVEFSGKTLMGVRVRLKAPVSKGPARPQPAEDFPY